MAPRRLSITALLFALSACGASDHRDGVGGVSSDETQALNAAAAMLDNRGRNAAEAVQNRTGR